MKWLEMIIMLVLLFAADIALSTIMEIDNTYYFEKE